MKVSVSSFATSQSASMRICSAKKAKTVREKADAKTCVLNARPKKSARRSWVVRKEKAAILSRKESTAVLSQTNSVSHRQTGMEKAGLREADLKAEDLMAQIDMKS